jgi:MFS superfamily sulfate permease-like transporter
VQLVVLFLGSVPHVDLAGAELISDLHRTLRARGVALRLAETHGEVRDALRRIGFEREYGALESGQTVDVVVSEWEQAAAAERSARAAGSA